MYCANSLQLDPEQAQLVKARFDEAGIAFMTEFPAGTPRPRSG